MMSHSPGHQSSNSIVLNTHNRSEFIEKFKQQHNNSNARESGSFQQGRWDYLHDLNKLKNMKLEEQRQKMNNEREDIMFSECTFSPKLNKSITYSKSNLPTQNNRIDTEPYGGLLERQEAWNQRKSLHIETLKQNKTVKELDQCFFKPELNPPTSLNKSQLKSTTTAMIEDPESYNMFVTRLGNKRKQECAKKEREKSIPGSGHVWSSKPKNYNLSYDYTKHENTTRNYTKTTSSIGSLRKPLTPKKFSTKVINPTNNHFPRNKMHQQNNKSTNKDMYYDYMYNAHKEDIQYDHPKKTAMNSNITKSYNNTTTTATGIHNQKHQNFHFDEQVEYGKAIDILHNELYSFPLMNDE